MAATAVVVLAGGAFAGWLSWRAVGESSSPGDGRALPAAAADGRTGRTPDGSADGRTGSRTDDRPPATTRGTREGRLSGRTIVIDPGHNPGNFRHSTEINRLVDVGTHRKECDTTGTETEDGYTEAAFTRDVSQRLRTLLEKEGAQVVVTHEEGERAFGPCIDERARIGNEAKADAVISVHADGSAEGHRGFHVILPGKVVSGGADTTAIVDPSRLLGERVVDAFARATGSAPANYLGGGTGLDVRTDLGGLNLSTVPKVFVECGNMGDPRDAALLADGAWRQQAALGIAEGLGAFLAPAV
ncbi:N-acetylmuramoyl-L-alanine amidase [Streptomyces sp. NPDC003691]